MKNTYFCFQSSPRMEVPSYAALKKNLKKDFTAMPVVKLAVLADSASQLLVQAIKAYGYEVKINFDIYEADYDQADLEIFDASSALYAFSPDYIFINRSSENLLSHFNDASISVQAAFAAEVADHTRQYLSAIAAQLPAKVIINTFPEIHDGVFGNFAGKVSHSFLYQLRKANMSLMDICRENGSAYLCDIALLQAELGYRFVFDAKMYISAGMVYSLDFLPYIAKNIAGIVLSISGRFNKCLILDLDNTTWGGIIGDDGLEGIQLGQLGLGKAFTRLQQWTRQLKQRGIILAVCSKNTEEIAQEPFLSHPDMVLHMEDIAVFAANWENKADNIRYIQAVLNIGFDTMVFIDDNPFEREMVRSAIPEITVPELPEDPAEYLPYLASLNLFETASVTANDEQRTLQYQQEAKRQTLQHNYGDENDFLQQLKMTATARAIEKFDVPRVAQLSQRSNQFNLRTIRYTGEDIRKISDNPTYYTLALTLNDRFGDHGLVGAVILKKTESNTLFIDTWIMSCRVLKRGMENFTMNAIATLALASGYDKITAAFVPTAKNSIVKDLLPGLGFMPEGDQWALDLHTYKNLPTFINETK